MIEIDMKMPSCCDECFALDFSGDYPCCIISEECQGYNFNVYENRMPSCPLKDNEPRVLTLEEVKKLQSIRDGAIWMEIFGNGLFPALPEFSNKSLTFFVAILFDGYRSVFENDWYGKTWRCWSAKPTEEQRKAVKWDD